MRKLDVQLSDMVKEDSAGMAGGGTSSEMSKKGTGPRPMLKEA